MLTEERYIGRPVRSLQTMLRTVAKAGAPIPFIIPDGIFGSETEAAVAAFQRFVRLPVTGKVDLATHELLVIEFDKAGNNIGPAAPLEIILQPNQSIELHGQNDHLYLAQAMFLVLGTRFGNVPAIAITGTLDAQTQTALLWLQKLSGLPETGSFDRPVWRYLTRLYRSSIQDGTGTRR